MASEKKSAPGSMNVKDQCGNTPLHIAAMAGHADAVGAILEDDKEVDHRNQEGETPLHLAAEGGHQEVVAMLLEAGADPSIQNSNGATPADLANAGRFGEIVRILNERMETMKRKTKGNQLLEAAKNGSIEELKRLLETGLFLEEKNEKGETALFIAASRGHDQFVKMLLDAGADPYTTSENGSTVLHAAAKSGSAIIIKRLSSRYKADRLRGANEDLNIPEREVERIRPIPINVTAKEWQDIYKTCANIHLSDSDNEEEKNLKKHVEDQFPIIEDYLSILLCSEMNDEKIKELRQFLEDELALMCQIGDLQVDMNLGKGSTLLHVAAACRAEKVVSFLIKRNADVRARNRDGVTPLIMSCAGESLEIVKMLVEAGAEVRDKDLSSRTPLHYAVRFRSLPITEYFLDAGLDPNARDIKGNTPLHLAHAFYAGAPIIGALLKAGADPRVENFKGSTPFPRLSEDQIHGYIKDGLNITDMLFL